MIVLMVTAMAVELHNGIHAPMVWPCPVSCAGVNIGVASDGSITRTFSDSLPPLPANTARTSFGPTYTGDLNGTIVVAGPLSLSASDSLYSYSKDIRQSLELFAQWLNEEHGGVRLHGGRYGMRFVSVGEGSSPWQVAAATAHAVRSTNADFVISSYSSGLTEISSQQSYADGKLMVSAGAAKTAIFTRNELTFGFYPAASTYVETSLAALAAAARRLDEAGTPTRCSSTGTSCVDSLSFAFVQVDSAFPREVCNATAIRAAMISAGLPMPEPLLLETVASNPSDADMDAILGAFRDQGANVIVGCTYFSSATALIDSLERIDFAPFAVLTTEAVSNTAAYTAAIANGWWQGDYVLGPAVWHKTVNTAQPGQFSGMTSSEFVERFRRSNPSTKVSYVGAANFAAACALAEAIERANSLDSYAVAAALETTDLWEFYGRVAFNMNHQIELSMVVLQVAEGADEEEVVFPENAVTSGQMRFPMPTWAQRRCGAIGSEQANNYSAGQLFNRATGARVHERLAMVCSGNGQCSEIGTCVCNSGWTGRMCRFRDASCGPGTEPSSVEGECTPCQRGFYKSSFSNSPCLDCPVYATTTNLAASEYTSCVCRAGYYRTSELTPATNCRPCPTLAVCEENAVVATLGVRPGAWRMSNRTTELYECARSVDHERCECLGTSYMMTRSQLARNFTELWGAGTYGSSCQRAWDSVEAWCLPGGDSEGASWCWQRWCYVPRGCPGAQPSDFLAGSDVELFYSYEQCGGGNNTYNVSASALEPASPSVCRGGNEVGLDGAGYCRPGFHGPLCAACVAEDVYFDEETATCELCPQVGLSLVGLFSIILGLLALGLLLQLVYRLASAWQRTLRWVGNRLTAMGAIAKLKIVFAFLQIWLNVPSFYGVVLPSRLVAWYDAVAFISLNIDALFPVSVACLGGSLASRLQIVGLGPLVVVAVVYAICLGRAATSRICSEALNSLSKRVAGSSNAAERPKGEGVCTHALLLGTPTALLVLFLTTPSVSLAIFQTWLCEEYVYEDDPLTTRSFLKLSISIECDTEEYHFLEDLAWIFFSVWPVGMPLLFATLLAGARHAIVQGRPTRLSKATEVLHSEYRPAVYYWEFFEMCRRVVLSGFFVALFPGEELATRRLVVAELISLAFLCLQLIVRPYRRDSDNLLAAVAACGLCLAFFAAMLIRVFNQIISKCGAACSSDMIAIMGFDSAYALSVALVCIAAALVVLVVGSLIEGSIAARRRSQLAREEDAENAKMRGRIANPPSTRWVLGPGKRYCCFLSHYKMEAGSDARYLRDLIQNMCCAEAYLDSENLINLSDLFSLGLRKSDVMVVLATKDYLTRPWCLLELWEAHCAKMPVLLVPISGRGFDRQSAREQITRLEHILSAKALDDVISHLKHQNVENLDTFKRALFEVMRLDTEVEEASHVRITLQERSYGSSRVRRQSSFSKASSAGLLDLSEALSERDPRETVVWEPWANDHQILAHAQHLVNAMATLMGRDLVWTEGLQASIREYSGSMSGRWSASSHASSSRSSHASSATPRSARPARLFAALAELSRKANVSRDANVPELLILLDRDDIQAARAARMLQHMLKEHLAGFWLVSLACAGKASLSFEIFRVDVVLLVLSSRVFHSAIRLVQLYEAIVSIKPLLIVRLARDRVYSFEEAQQTLSSPSSALPAAEVDSLHSMLTNRNATLARLAAVLGDTIPKIISQTFDPDGSKIAMQAFCTRFAERLPRHLRRRRLQQAARKVLTQIKVERIVSAMKEGTSPRARGSGRWSSSVPLPDGRASGQGSGPHSPSPRIVDVRTSVAPVRTSAALRGKPTRAIAVTVLAVDPVAAETVGAAVEPTTAQWTTPGSAGRGESVVWAAQREWIEGAVEVEADVSAIGRRRAPTEVAEDEREMTI